jgi:hypothetical protein
MTVAGFFAIDPVQRRSPSKGSISPINQKTLTQGVYQIQLTPYTNKLDKRYKSKLGEANYVP